MKSKLIEFLVVVGKSPFVWLKAVTVQFKSQNVNISSKIKGSGWVQVESKRSLYFEFYPGSSSDETLILLTGLTQDHCGWYPALEGLKKSGVNVLNVDLNLQGYSLTKRCLQFWKGNLSEGATIQQQVADLQSLKDLLEIRKPVSVAGLSYGGTVGMLWAAQHPKSVKAVYAFAPFVKPLKRQHEIAEKWIAGLAKVFKKKSQKSLYDFVTRILVYLGFPPNEPSVLKYGPMQLFMAGEMLVGMHHLAVQDVANEMPDRSLYLFVGENDEYAGQKLFSKFWQSCPERVKAGYITVLGSRHKIVMSQGPRVGEWLGSFLKNPKDFPNKDEIQI